MGESIQSKANINKQSETYTRNEILSYTSKNKQSIKPRNDIAQKQDTIKNVLSEHNKNMTNWDIFTQKMNNQYNECKNDIEQKQNRMESVAEFLKKLAKQKNELKELVTNNNEM